LECLLIEKNRVNLVLDFMEMRGTQADMIAVALINAGLTGMLLLRRGSKAPAKVLIN